MPIENRGLAAGTRLVARYKKADRTCEVVETADGLRYQKFFLPCQLLEAKSYNEAIKQGSDPVGMLVSGTATCAVEVRAIEVVVEEARDEFDGEDPLHPDVRRLLDEAKTTLLEVHAGFDPYVTGIALPEPGNAEVGLVRRLVGKASAS